MTLFDKLKAPFSPDRVSWRVGSTTQDKKKGLAFGYIDARDVMERLDEVCGPGNWQNRYSHTAGKTVCDIGIKCGDEWVWKADGAGDTDVEAEKGALSDAFKRAAVRWGIGRYLYDIPATWVEIEPSGRSFKIKESEFARLGKVLGGKAPERQPTKPDRITSGPQPKAPSAEELSQAALDCMAHLDECQTVKAIENYGASIASIVASLPMGDQAAVRNHFSSRKKALKQAENLAA